MSNEQLFDALDGLMAYDHGATDSGIHDENLRQQVNVYLAGLDRVTRNKLLTQFLMVYCLSDAKLAEGYGLADVKVLLDWLDSEMDVEL